MKFQQHIADIEISEWNMRMIIKYTNEGTDKGKYHSLLLHADLGVSLSASLTAQVLCVHSLECLR